MDIRKHALLSHPDVCDRSLAHKRGRARKNRVVNRVARRREKRFWQKEIEQWDAKASS